MTTKPAADILLVDDQAANLDVLSRLLVDHGYKVRTVTSGERAIEAAHHAQPDCMLLDVSMPGLDGYATCAKFQADPLLQRIPIIFLTAHDDTEHKLRAFRAGGRDYITKPFEAEVVLARVRNQLRIAELEAEQRRQNEALSEANARLSEAGAHKARVTAMLVHDVRNPLTVIGAVLDEALLDQASLEDARVAYQRVSTLLAEMLALSKSDSIPARPSTLRVEVNEIVEMAARFGRYVADQRGIEMSWMPSSERLVLEGDPEQLERVFANLLGNALKFTAEGGKVMLGVREEFGAGVESGLRFACITVADTGVGIPPEELPFVFDPYRQGKLGEKRGGVGLGLAIVARIVATHRGRVRVFSQLGVGTEFRVLLPL